MVVLICEYTENHLITHFKWVNCITCELYLYKTFLKKLSRKRAILFRNLKRNIKGYSTKLIAPKVISSAWALMTFRARSFFCCVEFFCAL